MVSLYASLSFAERWAKGACSLACSDHPPDHPMCITGHPGSVFPHHYSSEETPVRGYIQPQLTGGSWSQTGDGQCPQSAPRGETNLKSAELHHMDVFVFQKEWTHFLLCGCCGSQWVIVYMGIPLRESQRWTENLVELRDSLLIPLAAQLGSVMSEEDPTMKVSLKVESWGESCDSISLTQNHMSITCIILKKSPKDCGHVYFNW